MNVAGKLIGSIPFTTMKSRMVFLFAVVVCLGFVFFSAKKEKELNVVGDFLPKLAAETAEINSHRASPQYLGTDLFSTNGPFAAAYRMALYIDQVHSTLPQQAYSERMHLKGIQAVFFISDYLMMAKTNKSLPVSKSAIVGAFTNISTDASMVTYKLSRRAMRSGTLTDHYSGIRDLPAEKNNIATVEACLSENGIPIDTESDLFMDCIRYAVQFTAIEEMYGPNPMHSQTTHNPRALDDLNKTSDLVFRHRFETKFQLNPQVVNRLMNQLQKIRVYNLSPADIEIPVVFWH